MRIWTLAAASLFTLSVPGAAGMQPANSEAETPSFPLCGEGELGEAEAAARKPLLVEDLGQPGILADTDNEEAQRWFAQGVNFIWGFDEVEGVRAFQQAQALDPDCAMCFWGEAWARSPTINLGGRTEQFAAAKAAATRAAALKGKLPANAQAMIEAMQLRTAGADAFDNEGYADRMEALAARFPQDDTIAVMAADARMQVTRGDKIPHGTKMQQQLEGVLARNPDHIGAIHFYIHLSDWIEDQQLAEAGADRLGRLAPASSHLVHMPSHTFYGLGRYKDAMQANLAAIAADQAYAKAVAPPQSDYRDGLHSHNTNFVVASALMIGDEKTALQTADYFQNLFADRPDDVSRQFARASAYFAYGVYGTPDQVRALPAASAKTPLLDVMRHYAIGEAYARAGNAKGARAEAQWIAQHRGTVTMASGQETANAMMDIAGHVLEGQAAMVEGRYAAAETAYRKAMKRQVKARFSTDPPTWWYPIRRDVAAAQLARGDARSARDQLLVALRNWPNDAVAYALLARAEDKLGRTSEAAAYRERARSNWAGSPEALAALGA